VDDFQQRIAHELRVSDSGEHVGLQRPGCLESSIPLASALHHVTPSVGGVGAALHQAAALEPVDRARHRLCLDPRPTSQLGLVEGASVEEVEGDESGMGESTLLERLDPRVLDETCSRGEQAPDRPARHRIHKFGSADGGDVVVLFCHGFLPRCVKCVISKLADNKASTVVCMASSRDTVRQVVVLLSAILAVAGAFVGSGAAGGTPIQDAAGGALSADATPIAPAGPAFSIWSVIYIGLIGYAIWQLLPAQRTSPRHRRLGYPIAASLLLNAAWILSIQFDLLPLSVPVIAVLLAVLVWALRTCFTTAPSGIVDTVLTDGTVGLYLGWVCVATAANIAAFLTAVGFTGFGIDRDVWAVAVVAIAGAVGVLLAVFDRGRIAPTLSLSWGLAWLAYGRLTGDVVSVPTAVTAIVSIVAVVGATILLRVKSGRTGGRSMAASSLDS
jgi:hypothetical protein